MGRNDGWIRTMLLRRYLLKKKNGKERARTNASLGYPKGKTEID